MQAALAPWACALNVTRGRRHPEVPSLERAEHQRDRDRIVHSSAFRRLVYKTQVFINHEGDLFRTRLTHSLEVAQLGRSIARGLALNEDLVEAICLAHDLGHTPFGHAGQDALNVCMQGFGGFEHNLQSLRVVDALEERYPHYDGINLTFETREGILKHCSRANAVKLESEEPNGVAARFLSARQTSLEGQLANLADAIAYNAHDVDDGVRSGLISIEQLLSVPLFAYFHAQALEAFSDLAQPTQARRLLYETIRRMLSAQVHDVIHTTKMQIARSGVCSVDDVRLQAKPLVCFGESMHTQSLALKHFLLHQLYRHPQVMQTMATAQHVIHDLFNAYSAQPNQMKPRYALRAQQAESAVSHARAVADFIAGMTDRYAAQEHEKITGQQLLTKL
jgi:dGTPase